jgi:hypothetical protein
MHSQLLSLNSQWSNQISQESEESLFCLVNVHDSFQFSIFSSDFISSNVSLKAITLIEHYSPSN